MEGDAGASRLNPTDDEGSSDEKEVVTEAENLTDPAREPAVASPPEPSRLGRRWLLGIVAVLLALGAGVATGGYFALRAHDQSNALARADVDAVRAAKDCVSATHAPNTAGMAAAQQKIIECSTGDFGAQAGLYSGMLVDAYQAANVQVQVSDMRAAVEKHNDDGSVEVLVALRVKVSNTEAQGQEQGYRLRVQMVSADGKYKIAKLDQVSS
ncbi:MAG: putative conserved associated rane protein [Mycobacterium sp.]|jgi:Mce-associated membrane protein|nr:putative conserved associated rane protein [Mycobacterium sp.]